MSFYQVGALIIGAGIAYWLWRKMRSETRSRPPPRGQNILLIGDSLAVGLGKPLLELARRDGATLSPLGVGGTRIPTWARGTKLTDAMLDRRSLVLVSLGTNDAAGNDQSIEDLPKDIAALLDRLEARGARVIWIAPPDMPTLPRVGRVRLLIFDAVQDHPNAEYMPATYDPPRTSDHIHPTPAGYNAWAVHIWMWIFPT